MTSDLEAVEGGSARDEVREMKRERLDAFARVVALSLRCYRKADERPGGEGRCQVDTEAERERLESFLIESKLSVLTHNIRRAGVSSLAELVKLSREELGRCSEDVNDRISLQIAVDKKRDELYPTMLAPRALRWWSAARAQTSETRRLASTDADQGPCPRAHGARAHGGATSARLSSS